MEGVFLRRKCYYIGCWKDDTVADNIIRQVADRVRSGKGTKCKLVLSYDGMKVITSTLLTGKTIKDQEKFSNISFATVNQYNPQCLLLFAKDDRRKYRIVAFRCLNATDAATFVSCYKDLRRARSAIDGNNFELKQIESGNWTLRAKQTSADKRQLNKIVDMIGDQTNVHIKQNGVMKTSRSKNKSQTKNYIVTNGIETEIISNENENNKHDGNMNQVDRRDSNTVGTQAVQVESNGVSENGLKDDLDDLSDELKEMKFMLESSAGIGADVYHDKDKNEVKIVQKTSELEAEARTEENDTRLIDAVVIDNDSSDDENNENKVSENEEVLDESKGKISFRSDESSEVRVVVPDYRSSGTQTAPTYVRRYIQNAPTTLIYGEPVSPRLSTTSYDSWRDDVVLRGKIAPRSVRARSAYISTSSTGSSYQGSLRERNPNVVYATTTRAHHTLPHHSLRVPMRRSVNLSSTIERPIEKVYPRPRSAHSSIIYRPPADTQRGTIYAVPTTSKKLYVDKNHNKIEMNGHRSPLIVKQHKREDKGDIVILKT